MEYYSFSLCFVPIGSIFSFLSGSLVFNGLEKKITVILGYQWYYTVAKLL